MADTKITALAAITVVDPAVDVFPIVDVSDTSMAASGTTKKITSNQLLGAGGTATLASATITGALGAAGLNVTGATIPANGVYLPSANNLGFAYNSTLGMTLNSTGLGLGVSPAYRIDAQSPSGASTVLRLKNNTATDNVAIRFAGNQSNADLYLIGTNVGSNGTGANFQFYDTVAAATRMTLDASGNLLVGTTGTSWQTVAGFYYFAGSSLNVTRDGNACQLLNRLTSDGIIVDLRRSSNAVGNISVTTTGATFNSTSDYRLKESVAPLPGGLSRVNALKPSVYKWKSNGSDGEGFLAHELAEVVPAAVNGEKDAVNEDGTIKAQSIDMSRIVPILVAAIKELSAEVNALKNA